MGHGKFFLTARVAEPEAFADLQVQALFLDLSFCRQDRQRGLQRRKRVRTIG